MPGAVHLDPDGGSHGATARSGGRAAGILCRTLTPGRPSDAGIGPGTFVLAYDEGAGWAARLLVAAPPPRPRRAGAVDVRAYEGPLETEEPRVERAAFAARTSARRPDRGRGDPARLGDPSLVLYDARSPERWRGDVEPLDPVAGRIPGARNAFHFEGRCPRTALAAAELVFVLRLGRFRLASPLQRRVLAGRDDARLYPGSWSDWISRPSPSRKANRDARTRTTARPTPPSGTAPRYRRPRPGRRALDAEGHRLHRRGPRPPARRRRDDVDRDDAVQPQPARARAARQARHPRGRRHADGVQHDRRLGRRLDGHRGDARLARLARGDRRLDRARRARAPVRRARLPRRLRQDEPGRGDGARPARHPRASSSTRARSRRACSAAATSRSPTSTRGSAPTPQGS